MKDFFNNLKANFEKRVMLNKQYIKNGHWGLSGHALIKKYKL